MHEDSHAYVTLEHALNKIFVSLHHNSCILIIVMNTVAIMMPFSVYLKCLIYIHEMFLENHRHLVTMF